MLGTFPQKMTRYYSYKLHTRHHLKSEKIYLSEITVLLLVKFFIGLARLPKECGLERKLCRVSGDRVKTIIPPSRHQP